MSLHSSETSIISLTWSGHVVLTGLRRVVSSIYFIVFHWSSALLQLVFGVVIFTHLHSKLIFFWNDRKKVNITKIYSWSSRGGFILGYDSQRTCGALISIVINSLGPIPVGKYLLINTSGLQTSYALWDFISKEQGPFI